MTARRGHGEGSISKRKDGRWQAMLDLGWQDGKRKRKPFYGKTRAEVAKKLSAAQAAQESGLPLGDARLTVRSLLTSWLELQRCGPKSPNTLDNYAWAIDTHLVPALGTKRLVALQPEDVDHMLQVKAEAGLSRNTVARLRNVLSAAIHHAQRRGWTQRNVAELSEVPRCKAPAERRALSVEEGRALLDAAAGDRLEALLVLGIMTGLRPGELTGLLWSDLDLDAGRLTVSASLKREGSVLRRGDVKRSRAGQRTIDLAATAQRKLVEHRAVQAAERLAAGPDWSGEGYVFCTSLGGPLDPSNVRRTFARVAARAGIPPTCPYEMRHTAASHLIDAGRSVEEVADLLGNDPRTLYRHYRHRTRGSVDAAAGPMETLFGTPAGEFGGQFGGQTAPAGSYSAAQSDA